MTHRYEVGTRAWQPDPEEGWVASEVKEQRIDGEAVTLVFALENGQVFLPCPLGPSPLLCAVARWSTLSIYCARD